MAHPRKDDCERTKSAREALIIMGLLRYLHWRLDVESFPGQVEFNPIARHEGEDSEFRASCWALEMGIRGTTCDDLMMLGWEPESCCSDCWREVAQNSKYTLIHLGEMVLSTRLGNSPNTIVNLLMGTLDTCL